MSLSTGSYTFQEVFEEFYALFRGRVTNLPTFTTNSREYKFAIQLGNNAIKKWNRTDGMLWRELIDLASKQNTTVWPTAERTVATATLTYAAPTNMRKPPASIRLGTATIPVVDPQDVLAMASNTTYAYFSGGANNFFTLNIPSTITAQYNGELIDFIYDKKPTLLTSATDPAATVIEMSDPSFMIHYMVMLRSIKQRTGFVYQTSLKEASEALQNMKLENMTGNYEKTWNSLNKELGGWGRPAPADTFLNQ